MEDQQKVNKVLLEIAKRKDLPLILTNDCHYTESLDKRLHEAALCIQTHAVLSDEKRFSFGDIDVHVGDHDWMWTKAIEQDMPYDAISNTASLADMVDADSYFSDRKNRYPKFKDLKESTNSWEELEILSKKALFNKFSGMPPIEYRERLDSELKTIKKMGFSDYILIVWQFLNGARDEGVYIGPGRGSAAGSLVAYALDITRLDPIKYGLIFERFLNVGRAATPIVFNDEMYSQIESLQPTKQPCGHKH
jgi:DNA polymerase-3 subunit alpha